MKVVVTGGTGFLGEPLVEALRRDAHDVVVLTRSSPRGPGDIQWRPSDAGGGWVRAFEGAGAVINLAGEPIAAGRWTTVRKRAIRESRVEATRAVVAALRQAGTQDVALLSGSAIGYYGATGDEPLDEYAPAGTDFLGSVCRDWEREARAAEATARVVLLRTGLVLAAGGGALQQLALPFHFFAGGPLGSGSQVMSWIHRDDWIAMVRWALANSSVSGPVNMSCPERPRTAAAVDSPCPGVRTAARPRRDGRRDDPQRAARAARAGAEPRVQVSIRDHRRRAGGDLPGLGAQGLGLKAWTLIRSLGLYACFQAYSSSASKQSMP